MVTTGILGTQHTLQDRGYNDIQTFEGVTTVAGRQNELDSLIGRVDCVGKVGQILRALSVTSESFRVAFILFVHTL